MSIRVSSTPSSSHLLLWFVAAFVVMVASQIFRLHQTDTVLWLVTDYAGRIGALAVLSAAAATRGAILFRRERLKISIGELALWLIVLLILDRLLDNHVRIPINDAFPGTVLGTYPTPNGWLKYFDLTFGLLLVAVHEEIVFRRCLRTLLESRSDALWLVILISALLFGAFHWTFGLGNAVNAALSGAIFMIFYYRAGILWPVIVSHYLIDLRVFT